MVPFDPVSFWPLWYGCTYGVRLPFFIWRLRGDVKPSENRTDKSAGNTLLIWKEVHQRLSQPHSLQDVSQLCCISNVQCFSALLLLGSLDLSQFKLSESTCDCEADNCDYSLIDSSAKNSFKLKRLSTFAAIIDECNEFVTQSQSM